ncbi:hypothetical protein B0J13DRAFT_159584 [Dactylonectria estremocensis]|uniref:Uncharacterized protein n=1 Tax=Dactylonectria estremocensis TaxID=1079267 RepID=A0A9P9IJU2_9HYPO|nr:hypothetical protein B0J13DRAFT_159584 [Dactylonectria estremocensis]
MAQEFRIRKSPHDSKLLVVHPAGYAKDAYPLYCIKPSSKKPNVIVSRGPMSPATTVGFATLHSFSSKIDASVRGQAIPMKGSAFSDKFTLNVPHLGTFKWKESFFSGSLELYDSSGQKLAKLGSAGTFSSEKKLELMVPCDDFFMDIVVLSGIAARQATKNAEEAVEGAVDAVSAAAGV